ncbi:hypothetical protein [Leucobacter musarum]|uniref:hypothetical protein n=1 Tax=Leucobacter musarum TaxID=1930747 RepID=UPI0006A7D2F5|nr:hypothetical protein [Leucobacter musarum]
MNTSQHDSGTPHSNDAQPSAASPESVAHSVPEAAERVGQTGPDAADPPRAGATESQDSTNGVPDSDTELDADEGADAFETTEEAEAGARDTEAHSDAPRDDLPHINVDTPD